MAKLFLVAVLVLCLSWRSSANPTEGTPAGNPLASLMNIFQTHNPATNCPKVCGEECAIKAAVCFDIPEVRDCAANTAACAASCQTLCTCVGSCASSCVASEDCGHATGVESMICKGKRNACVAQCQARCPVDEFTRQAQTKLGQLTTHINGAVEKVKAQFGGLAGE